MFALILWFNVSEASDISQMKNTLLLFTSWGQPHLCPLNIYRLFNIKTIRGSRFRYVNAMLQQYYLIYDTAIYGKPHINNKFSGRVSTFYNTIYRCNQHLNIFRSSTTCSVLTHYQIVNCTIKNT